MKRISKDHDKQIINAFGRVFTTRDGELVLDHIRMLAKDRMLGNGTTDQIMQAVGAHDLVVQLENKIEVAKHGG